MKYVYFFGDGKAEGKAEMKNELGGKGANLAEMTNLGIPVPPGFTINTDTNTAYFKAGGKLPEECIAQSKEAMTKVEAIKQTFRVELYLHESKDTPDGRGRIAAKCPLPGHDDKHMSFWYHPIEQVCACAKCTGQGTWDVINLYAAMHGLSNKEAIEQLYQLTDQGMREPR